MGRAGLNTGNLLFTEAIHRTLGGAHIKAGFKFDPAVVNAEHDCLVVAAANWLSSGPNLDSLASLIDQTKLPIIVVGLGAQSPDESHIPVLKSGTKKLVDIFSDRNAHVAVRGPFSATVCHELGLQNVTVTGCPSILWHTVRAPSVSIQSSEVSRVALTTSRGVPDLGNLSPRSETARLNGLLSRMAMREDWHLIAQAEYPDIFYALGRGDEDVFREKFEGYLEALYACSDRPRLSEYLERRMKLFFTVSEWVGFLSSVDLVFGTRLHGSVAALLAGKPTVLVTHDSRTRETAKFMGIPSIPSTEVHENFPVKSLLSEFDANALNIRLAALYRGFKEFFDKCGIRHALVPETSMDLRKPIQKSTTTAYDRHPEIFASVANALPNARSVLSFGCSDGSEAASLVERYFAAPCSVTGVDVNVTAVERARSKNLDRASFYTASEYQSQGAPFDAVFAMSVLCSHPDTRDVADCSQFITFDGFDKVLREITASLRPGGILAIYNSNFRLEDSSVADGYEAMPTPNGVDARGYVSKFGPDNLRLTESQRTSGVIFRKK